MGEGRLKNALRNIGEGWSNMARKKLSVQEQVTQGLTQLALGSVNDAVSLLFMSEEEIMQRLPKLKLFNVSEIKRPKGGGMEIKFFDRIKAMERLSYTEASRQESALSFYEALEKSAVRASRENGNDEI